MIINWIAIITSCAENVINLMMNVINLTMKRPLKMKYTCNENLVGSASIEANVIIIFFDLKIKQIQIESTFHLKSWPSKSSYWRKNNRLTCKHINCIMTVIKWRESSILKRNVYKKRVYREQRWVVWINEHWIHNDVEKLYT